MFSGFSNTHQTLNAKAAEVHKLTQGRGSLLTDVSYLQVIHTSVTCTPWLGVF